MITIGRPVPITPEAYNQAHRMPWWTRLALKFVRGQWVGEPGEPQWYIKWYKDRLYIMDKR